VIWVFYFDKNIFGLFHMQSLGCAVNL